MRYLPHGVVHRKLDVAGNGNRSALVGLDVIVDGGVTAS